MSRRGRLADCASLHNREKFNNMANSDEHLPALTRQRLRQGWPRTIEDPQVIDRLARLVESTQHRVGDNSEEYPQEKHRPGH
jgi:hypothetical protein